jgi:hypothetical protein
MGKKKALIPLDLIDSSVRGNSSELIIHILNANAKLIKL